MFTEDASAKAAKAKCRTDFYQYVWPLRQPRATDNSRSLDHEQLGLLGPITASQCGLHSATVAAQWWSEPSL